MHFSWKRTFLSKTWLEDVFDDADILFCHPDFHLCALPETLLEVPSRQDVGKGMNAAAGVAEAHGDVVAHVKGQGQLRNLKIHELDHMEWGSTYHRHTGQSKHHLSEPHGSLPGDTGGVTAKQRRIPSMESQGGKMMVWIECTNEWQLSETKFTYSANKGQLSTTSFFLLFAHYCFFCLGWIWSCATHIQEPLRIVYVYWMKYWHLFSLKLLTLFQHESYTALHPFSSMTTLFFFANNWNRNIQLKHDYYELKGDLEQRSKWSSCLRN